MERGKSQPRRCAIYAQVLRAGAGTGLQLAGKLFDESGECRYAAGPAKGERRYRYYVSRRLIAGSAEKVGNGWRLSARTSTCCSAYGGRQSQN